MLMTSILLQKQERPSEAAPVFISRIPFRSLPEIIPKEKLGKWKGKTDAIADRQSLLRDTSSC